MEPSKSPGKKCRDNPFARPDRVHFPVMTRAMWECPLDDSFSTPEAGGLLQRAGDGRGVDAFFLERERRGLLTPARSSPGDFMRRGSLFEPFSQSGSSSHSRVSEPGLTPGSASDVCTPMPTGCLPNQAADLPLSGQGRAVTSCLRDGRDAAASGPRLGGARGQDTRLLATRGVRFSPEVPAGLGRKGSTSSSSMCRTMETQTRISISPIEEQSPKADSNWSVSPVASPQQQPVQEVKTHERASSSASSACVVPPAVGIGPSPRTLGIITAAQQTLGIAATTRENDSLSVSSISFGKDDARMRGSESRDLGSQAGGSTAATVVCQAAGAGTSAHVVGQDTASLRATTGNVRPRSRSASDFGIVEPPKAGAGTKESVARQLDFDADGTPLRPPLQMLRPVAAPASPSAGIAAGRHKDWAVATGTPVPRGSPPYACTSGSELELVDWDSSLSREVLPVRSRSASATVFAPSPTTSLRQFSPLRSEGGCSTNLVIGSLDSSVSQALATPRGAECPYCGNRTNSASMQVESSAVIDGRPLAVAVERVSSSAEGGSILLQLRLGTREDRQQLQFNLDATAPGLHDSSGTLVPPPRSRPPPHKNSLAAAEKEDTASCCLSLSSLTDGPSLRENAAGPIGSRGRSASAHHLGVTSGQVPGPTLLPRRQQGGSGVAMGVLEMQMFQSKYRRGADSSIEELHFTVQQLRQRYLQHYFQVKPLRHSTCLSHSRHRTRATSDSQLLHGRRRQGGGCGGPRLRSGRTRQGSRLRGRRADV